MFQRICSYSSAPGPACGLRPHRLLLNPPASTQDSANDLSVAVGKTVLVDTAWPIKRVAINMSDIADVHATSPTEIMVKGKAPGETSLIVWDTHGGRQFFNVTVRASASALNDSLDAIRRELRTELPGQPLKVSIENGIDLSARNGQGSRQLRARGEDRRAPAAKSSIFSTSNVPASDPQILLKVRFVSVDRSKETQIGHQYLQSGRAQYGGRDYNRTVLSADDHHPAGIGHDVEWRHDRDSSNTCHSDLFQ